MTREEAVALLERYSNYDGMGIPNLAGCKEAMKVAVESLKEVYPELTESEDERIRKLLIWQVQMNIEDETNDLAQSVYDGIKGHDPDLEESIEDWKKCLAYLEKQKEEEGYEAIPVESTLEYKLGFKAGKESEKQKPMYNLEIPAGDVAPAEEDGPFDEDEFLEDELSAFIQNYDKEFADNAALSDVAKHFYEIGKKQKEQKPELPLMGGDTDTYFDDLRMTTKPLTSREWFNEGIKYAQRLQKEQEPAEWDDYTKTNLDRALQIIKKAKGNLQGYQSDDGIYECDKAIECLEHFLYRGLEIEKPAEWSEDYREEDIQTRFAFYTYKDDPSVLYLSNVFVEETSRNHGFGTRILKAAEKVAETIGATTISLKVKQDSPANAWYRKNGYGYVAFEDGYDWLEKNLEYMKPVKQEWSEEDENSLEYIHELISFGYEQKFMDAQTAADMRAWVNKSLKNRGNFPKSNTNSPKDCNACPQHLEGYISGRSDAENKLLEMYGILLMPDGELRMKPRWKPSEEQMEALQNAVALTACDKELTRLYEDLKKL